MSRSRVKEYPSLVWLRRVRAKLAAEYAKGPNSRAARERQRKVDALIAKLGLRRMPADAARARPRRPA